MTNNLNECYRLLDVEPGAPLEEVKRSYRELVRVWHPDRFTHDLKLQAKAQEKLKQINLAYERICNRKAEEPRGTTTSAKTNTTRSEERAQASASGTEGTWNHPQQAAPEPTRPRTAQTSWARRVGQVALWVIIAAIVKAVVTTNTPPTSQYTYRSSNAQTNLPRQVYTPPVVYTLPKVYATPAVQPESKAPTAKDENDVRASLPKTSEPAATPSAKIEPAAIPANKIPRGYFTVGSTKDEVLAVQGTPQNLTDTSFGYAYSTVYFQNGRVKSWSNISKNLRVKMFYDSRVQSAGYFTVGSTKDEVLAVQGTPQNLSDTSFGYEYSTVYFENGRVKSWSNISNNLKAGMAPASRVPAAGYFTVGSTKDEVLAVQGTPQNLTDTSFGYAYSTIRFENGRVKSWSNISKNLKVKMFYDSRVQSAGYFTVGSTKDEVLAVQGTPQNLSDTSFGYAYSTVYFENGRVKSWNNISKNLKIR